MAVGICTNNIDIAIQPKKSSDSVTTSKDAITDSIFTHATEKTKPTDKLQKEEATKKPKKEKPIFDKVLNWLGKSKNLAGMMLCTQGSVGLLVALAMSSPIMGALLGSVALTSIGLGIYCLANKKN